MSLNLENFEEVRLKGEEVYKSLTFIRSPFLKKDVHFNAQGLEHLKFKDVRKARPRQDQYMRFKLIHLAPKVLEKSNTLQGIMETKGFEKIRSNNRTERILKEITYYEFIAVIEEVRVKVIVKEAHDVQPVFWSIIPYWGVDKENKRRKLHSGYPSKD
jgi:hypothetical protein